MFRNDFMLSVFAHDQHCLNNEVYAVQFVRRCINLTLVHHLRLTDCYCMTDSTNFLLACASSYIQASFYQACSKFADLSEIYFGRGTASELYVLSCTAISNETIPI